MGLREPTLIVNVTRGSVVCEHGILADRPFTRMRGLLGRSALPAGEGLLLKPASSIHTVCMRFAIDAVFLDSGMRVVKLSRHLKPWRTSASRHATAVLELADGEADRRGLQLEDRLALLRAVSKRTAAPTRVLLLATDRRFRSMASMLLTRRGYHVITTARDEDPAEAVMRESIDVVVIDASASAAAASRGVAKLRALCPLVGVVAVSDADYPQLSSLPVLLKWGAFGALFDAIDNARGCHPRRRLPNDAR